MLEKYLIEHCSPTLASIKTANLFSMVTSEIEDLKRHIKNWNDKFREKGVEMILLKEEGERALIYLCRKNQLQKDLNKDGVSEFMKNYGYDNNDADYAISVLREKLKKQEDFPHEIGIFLGYPLGDVKGFITNSGKNSKCVGCWKVYCNECEALKSFERFDKCKYLYKKLWEAGKPLMKLTVAA